MQQMYEKSYIGHYSCSMYIIGLHWLLCYVIQGYGCMTFRLKAYIDTVLIVYFKLIEKSHINKVQLKPTHSKVFPKIIKKIFDLKAEKGDVFPISDGVLLITRNGY